MTQPEDVLRLRERLIRFEERPANRGTIIVHEVDESHPNTEACEICQVFDRLESAERALRDVIEWLEAEAEHPRPDPRPAMRMQAQQARAELSQPHSAEGEPND